MSSLPSSSSVSDDSLTIPSEVSHLQEPVLTKPIESSEEELPNQSELAEVFIPSGAPFYADAEAAENEQLAALSPPRWLEPEALVSPGMFLLFLAFLVFSNGLLSVYCFSYPDDMDAVLARLPVLRSVVAGERFSARHIVLSDLEGRYQITKDNHKVFTVSGTATNTATLPARTIQLEGAIYDGKGKIVGRRLIFCGTNIAPNRLTNLTLREIDTLQDLVPPKQFHVTAGDAVRFLVVFPSPPPKVTEFSGRVVAAQFGGA